MPRKRKGPRKSTRLSLLTPEGKAGMIREKARASFDTARMGYLDWIDEDPFRESMGVYNAIVFGWAALTILGKVKSIYREKFSSWYDPIMERFRADPLLGWYIELRNEVLKEGAPQMQWHCTVEKMPDLIDRVIADVPPDAQMFMLPEIGWGWGVLREDGTPDVHYVKFTREIQEEFGVEIMFPNTPTEHGGKPLADRSARAVLLLCLQNIGEILDLADLQDFSTVEPTKGG